MTAKSSKQSNGLRILARHKKLRQHIKLDAAALGVVSAFVAPLTVDYFIARSNLKRPTDDQLRLVTEWGQDNKVLAVCLLVYLFGHGGNWWGRWDPIGIVGRKLGLGPITV